MTKAKQLPSMQSVEVKNFGPILEGNIELRPMTVFVGPSNTGKSYMAILIYALHKFFESSARHWYGKLNFTESSERFGSLTVNDIVEQVSLDVAEAFEDGSKSPNKKLILSDKVAASIVDFVNTLCPALDQDIERYFGRELKGLNNVSAQSSPRITIRRTPMDSDESFISVDYELGAPSLGMRTQTNLNIPIRENHPLIRNISRLQNEPDDRDRFMFLNARSSILTFITQEVVSRATGTLTSRAFYLPADRTAVMHAHSVVVASALQQVAETGLRHGPSSRLLNGVQADFLSTIIENLRPRQKIEIRRRDKAGDKKNELDLGSKHAKMIEEDVLQGSIKIERDELINYPNFQYRPKGWKDPIPLLNASSMVGELAPIVAFLRYFVRPGDLVIVEEPESHLHPAMQVKLFRILAGMVANGFKVLITTHSEWLIEELSNIVSRSKLRENSKNPTDTELVSLDPSMVGTWLFSPQTKEKKLIGSYVSEVEYDEDGMYPAGFDDVAQTLHNDWVSIASKLDK